MHHLQLQAETLEHKCLSELQKKGAVMNLPYILLYFCGDDGTRRYIVIRDDAIFSDEKDAIDYRDKLNAEWEKEQRYRDLIKSLLEANRKEQDNG